MPVSLEIVRLIVFRNCALKGRVGSEVPIFSEGRGGEADGVPVTRKRRAGGGR